MEFERVAMRTVIGLIVLASAFTALVPTAAAQNPVPAMQISMSPNQLTADITASQPGAVTFYGNVSVTKASYERAFVNLQPSMSTGWTVSIAPQSMVFSTGGSVQNFAVTVIVPPGEPATNIGQLTITGRATAAGVSSAPASATGAVIPRPYFRVVVAVDTPFIETQYSTQVAVSFKIFNEGNIRDTVSVDIKNLDDLSAKNWLPVLTRQKFLVDPPPANTPVQMSVGLPKKWSFYPNEVQSIVLQVTSQEGALVGQTSTDTVPIFFRVVGFSTPGFDTPLVIMGAIIAAMVMGASRKRWR